MACKCLGLIKMSDKGLVISNQIYKEIISRELTDSRQDDFKMRFIKHPRLKHPRLARIAFF